MRKFEKQLVYDNALGVERDENECVYLICDALGIRRRLWFWLVDSCIFLIEIARHFDITVIFNLHGKV